MVFFTRCIAVICAVLAFSCGAVMAAEAPKNDAAYVVRGKQTEGRQRALKERLDRFHDALAALLKRDAPDLLPRLEPPPPIEYGYQILPRILPDGPPRPPVKPQIVSYSWSWSDTLIAQQMGKLDQLEADLAKLQPSRPPAKRVSLEAVLDGYDKVIADRRLIDSDIDYNWLWQAAIERDRPTFDRITKRLDEVAGLQKEGKPLTPEIIAAIGKVNPPGFLHIESSAHRRFIVVPVVTDITDSGFVQKFKQAVETVWHKDVGGEDIRLRLAIETITPQKLYCSASPCSPPKKGEKIDLDAHAARFPKDHVILTTGAASLRIVAGPALVVSPHDVASRVLAHEFGHILGFPDGYFRGYRDIGADGYRIMELVTDSSDLMSDPGSGVVQDHHIEALVNGLDVKRVMQAGLDAFYKRNNPAEAIVHYRRVLELTPGHYGATFQLAKALDSSGNIAEAKVWWKKVLEMAEAIGDKETAATARKGLE